MNIRTTGLSKHLMQVFRGILMGGADIVPGVSGGTVALILGIYERLVTSISHFDWLLLKLIRRRSWQRAVRYTNLPFLIPLGLGILIGFVIMTTLMNGLLSDAWTRSLTLAMFFGLIFASGIVVALMIDLTTRRDRIRSLILGILGGLFALWVAGLTGSNSTHPNLIYLFFCGAIAICAMILPGISGAMILLVLGVYMHLTEIPRNMLHGQDIGLGAVQVGVFACGCAVGLITFSKLLRWLLARYHGPTIAVLCGFMFGSLRKLWPFQEDLTPWIEKVKYKSFRAVMPTTFDRHVVEVLCVVIGAAAIVLLLEGLLRHRRVDTSTDGK